MAMTRCRAGAAAAVTAALMLAPPARGEEFSAAIVRTAPGGAAAQPAGTLAVSNGRVRVDTGADSYLLVLPGSGAWLVRPAARVAIAAGASTALDLLVAVDPDAPCAAWQAVAGGAAAAAQVADQVAANQVADQVAAGDSDGGRWRCERSGGDAGAVRWRATAPQGRSYGVVIDPQLRFPVRIESDDGAVLAVGDVVHAAPSEALFVLPANYQKFSVRGLIERMKQSDVSGASTPRR